MKTSQKGTDLIKQFEGTVLKVYKDAVGLPTIGIGHLIKHNESFTTITQQQAEELLAKDLVQFEVGVTKAVRVTLNQNQFDALVSFSFNLGLGNLNSSTLLRKLNAGDYQGAASEFERWNKAGGKILTGLTRRRLAEKGLFLS
jgi:lysozyme